MEVGSEKRAYRSEKRGDWLVQIRHRVISGLWVNLETAVGSLETLKGWAISGDHLFLAQGRGRNCLPTDILFGPASAVFLLNLYLNFPVLMRTPVSVIFHALQNGVTEASLLSLEVGSFIPPFFWKLNKIFYFWLWLIFQGLKLMILLGQD